MVNHLIEACPNIESLQLGYKEYGYDEKPARVDFLSGIRFHNLQSLTLIRFQLQDESFLPSVIINYLGIKIKRPFTYVFTITGSEAVSEVRAPPYDRWLHP